MSKSKTEQTFDALKEIAQKNPYCEVKLLLTIHAGQYQGFDELEPPKIKFRAREVKGIDKVGDVL